MEQSAHVILEDMGISLVIRSGNRCVLGMLFSRIADRQASKVATVDKLSLVLVAVFAFAFLGERPATREWLGILLVTAGVLLLAYKR